ncbi:MAG: hypothetical protein ABIR31_10695, partial [Ginsengibacter sp.]
KAHALIFQNIFFNKKQTTFNFRLQFRQRVVCTFGNLNIKSLTLVSINVYEKFFLSSVSGFNLQLPDRSAQKNCG